jgi:hypothetical protein
MSTAGWTAAVIIASVVFRIRAADIYSAKLKSALHRQAFWKE